MAKTITWHKMEDRISIVIGLPSVNFAHFRRSNKGVKVRTEIIKISLVISVYKLCQIGELIS